MPVIMWFRQDLRLTDNPALTVAADTGEVLPVYIRDPGEAIGSASKWWLHHSLTALGGDLGHLVLRSGDPAEILAALCAETGADSVVWNRCYDPYSIARDTALKADLKDRGISAQSYNAALLAEPWEVETKSGTPFKVYSPFWRALSAREMPEPLPRPALSTIDAPSETLADWNLRPSQPNWAMDFQDLWTPGESGAWSKLESFLKSGLAGYAALRNRPDLPNVSRLSPHLHFGEISPRQIWARTRAETTPQRKHADKFLAEIGWREFSHHLLYHFPTLPTENWKPAFNGYPWRDDHADLDAWQQGQTGYPIVDAGMRELWSTGYMHNRVRMVVGSFLIKHLRLHWKHGLAWFHDTLLDADAANNSASWQWVAGCGADAAPYFRIFNPMTQGEKFDPDGAYVRKWCPELSRLPNKVLHAPFNAPAHVLAEAGVVLGETYPKPIVDHATARAAALAGYEEIKIAS
ncbi:MAG: deoxyribodipyrimidine photo-lyase [Pseudomonadota bacterium]